MRWQGSCHDARLQPPRQIEVMQWYRPPLAALGVLAVQPGAQAVADAVGVSVRYVNAVLSDHDTSIMRLIQARRLERCRCALEDPNQSHRSLSEIAYGWGFSDMTHFGRRFKKAYGILPSEYQIIARRAGRGGQF